MNVMNSEASQLIVAKTCGCNDRGRKVTYNFVDTYHALCLDKKDIMIAQLGACELLLKYASDEDRKTVEREIAELRMALDLLA